MIARLIENEIRVGLRSLVVEITPVVEKVFAKTGSFDFFEKLFWNDLIGIDVDAVHDRRQGFKLGEGFHNSRGFLGQQKFLQSQRRQP